MSDRTRLSEATAGGPLSPPGIDFADLFETAPCGYLVADGEGRITRANATFSAWTGWSAQALAGKRISDLLPIAERIFYESHVAPMLHAQRSLREVALDFLCPDGRKLPMLVNATAQGREGAPIAAIRLAVFTATERRSYERSLLDSRNDAQASVAAERANSELREQFIAVLGHDLRNPLASIASGAQLLRKEPLSERARTILRLVDGSVLRAVGLIDNVLDFARGRLGGGLTLSRDRREPLEPVLRQVVEELRAIAPDREIAASYGIDDPVECDRVRMGQLLSNLLGNALTHGAREEPVRLRAETKAGELVISVTNGGAPIAPFALERLFQPFFRGDGDNRHQGLGLGLHIASEIARAHGGTLVARSDVRETCFTFTMPLAPPAAPSP